MWSVQLIILPLQLAVCTFLPKPRLPPAFVHCMRKECASTVSWTVTPKCFALRVLVHICLTNYQDSFHCLSHANILHCAMFFFKSNQPWLCNDALPPTVGQSYKSLFRNAVMGADWRARQVTQILRAHSHSVSLPPRASCLNPFAETRQCLGRVHLNVEVPADYLAHAIIIMEAV